MKEHHDRSGSPSRPITRIRFFADILDRRPDCSRSQTIRREIVSERI
jgi:hypothetical protein